MPKFRVVGPCEVAGVAPGGEVDLDPTQVNIPALEAAGHVEPVGEKAVRPKKPAGDGGEQS